MDVDNSAFTGASSIPLIH